MKCFPMQKLKKKHNERAVSLEEIAGSDSDQESSPPTASALSSARRSFRNRVRAIQNAQWFINSNPKLRSSHPSYGSRESKTVGPEASSPLLPLGGRARSATELGSALLMVAATAFRPHPSRHLDSTGKNLPSVAAAHLHLCPHVDDACTNFQPLPSPRQVSGLLPKAGQSSNVYRLPLPSENVHNTPCASVGSLRSSTIEGACMHTSIQLPSASKHSKSSLRAVSPLSCRASCHQTQIGSNSLFNQPQNDTEINSSLIPRENLMLQANHQAPKFQPLPPPTRDALAVWPLRCFTYDELLSACQNFSLGCRIADADVCFNGTIKPKGNYKVGKHQDVVVLVLKEPQHQGSQEWMLKLSTVAHELHQPLHVCQLIGFYGEDGCAEHMLVYERLRKGTLFSLLFGMSDMPPLEWSSRMKIAYGAAGGLARLHELFPDIVLYREFRASSIQVDHDYSSKVSLYRFLSPLNSKMQTCSSSPRVNAYRAPETVSRGELTLKSNVWSFGVILLELLSGKQHLDGGATKNESLNLVKWAKPFLVDEGKLFLLMDPKLRGNFPSRGAKMVAHLALVCLRKDPTKRPSMREALDIVRDVHQSKSTAWCSTKDPIISHKACSPLPISGSAFVKPSLLSQQRPSHDQSPFKLDIVEKPPLKPLIIPPRCGGDGFLHHQQHDCSPAPLTHVKF
ncbi:hypothetical protein GOP47_0004859 [Adiantum capillus-veneris]|uniref:Protein kinase domain-containing protein n=1 Tax=Adiantum capillus-veneris TaxID=13818 RepID=A0A9D4V418_ADICA|nr:hypothetical protein GOP47_0004859 [Adiantum capillus-veneris]